MIRRAGGTARCNGFLERTIAYPTWPKEKQLNFLLHQSSLIQCDEFSKSICTWQGRSKCSNLALPFAFFCSFLFFFWAWLVAVLWLILNTSNGQQETVPLPSAEIQKQSNKPSLPMFYNNEVALYVFEDIIAQYFVKYLEVLKLLLLKCPSL